MNVHAQTILHRIMQHLAFIYHEISVPMPLSDVAVALLQAMRLVPELDAEKIDHVLWSEEDVVLITYGDSVVCDALVEGDVQECVNAEKPLVTLKKFLDEFAKDCINSVHILPFFPYSSDDGFSVMDFSAINQSLGDWSHIEKIATEYHLMADLVINHCSSRSVWFNNFLREEGPGHDYFRVHDAGEDLSLVIRPRTYPLIREVSLSTGTTGVWCTFSHDQVDFDFRNPQVLIEFANIIRLYLDKGVRIFRLDAIGFIWKKSGTTCLNLEETHEIVRLLRTLIEQAEPNAVLITETNVPNVENLAYFGNANEAHCIYNFSLPPLLLNTLIKGDCRVLKQWMMNMPPARMGTTYFNFIASHDGIGLRPAEGLITDEEIQDLINVMIQFGGRVSLRTLPDGSARPYEINIALFDALQGTLEGPDQWGIERFICAHAIMLAMEGIPGIYIHSFIGTRNDYKKMENTGQYRSINRHRWNYRVLCDQLMDCHSEHAIVHARLSELVKLRIKQPAFHPNATQFTLHLGNQLFGFWRQSLDRTQNIFCIYNVTDEEQGLTLADINLVSTEDWRDIISGQTITDQCACLIVKPYQAIWIANFQRDHNTMNKK